jgi:hypothetical protein
MRIRDGDSSDPGWKKVRSGINIPDPQHWSAGILNPNAADNKGFLIDDKLGGFIRASRMELDGIVGREV